MPTKTIALPQEVLARLKKAKGKLNVSKTCRIALEKELDRIERIKRGDDDGGGEGGELMLSEIVMWLVVEYERTGGTTIDDYEYQTTNLAVFDSKERAIAWVEANNKYGSWHPHGLEYRQDSWVSWYVAEMDFNPRNEGDEDGAKGTWVNRIIELESKIDKITRVLQGGEG